MNWTGTAIILAVVAVFYMLKRVGQISHSAARAHLENGALVIDVRSSAEYNSGHLPNAINLPLDKIEIALPRRVKDKSQLLLLHCQSGMRSGVARKKLKGLGYANAFNLGSYDRATRVVRCRQISND